MHEETAQIISNAIAVATTLTLPRLLIVLQLILPSILRALCRLTQRIRDGRDQNAGRLALHVLDTFQEADSIGAAATGLTREHLGMRRIKIGAEQSNFWIYCSEIYANFQEDKWGFCTICLAILGLGGFYIGIQVIAVLTVGIVSSRFGFSTSPACGWWLPTGPIGNNVTPGFNVITAEDEYEAIAYAESNYGTSGVGRSGSEYVSQKIDFQEYQDRPCPFAHECCVA